MSIKDTEFYPMPIYGNDHIGPSLLAALFSNVKAGIFGGGPRPSRHLTEDAWRQAGYCLDAPDTMPAGSTLAYSIDASLGDAAEQRYCYRDDLEAPLLQQPG